MSRFQRLATSRAASALYSLIGTARYTQCGVHALDLRSPARGRPARSGLPRRGHGWQQTGN